MLRQHFIQSIAQQCIRSVGTHEQKGGDFILSTKADADYKNRAALGTRMERFSCNSDLKLNLIKKQIKDREKIEPCAKISKKRLCRKSLNCFEIFAH